MKKIQRTILYGAFLSVFSLPALGVMVDVSDMSIDRDNCAVKVTIGDYETFFFPAGARGGLQKYLDFSAKTFYVLSAVEVTCSITQAGGGTGSQFKSLRKTYEPPLDSSCKSIKITTLEDGIALSGGASANDSVKCTMSKYVGQY